MKWCRKCEGEPKKVSPWIMNAAFISSALASVIPVSPSLPPSFLSCAVSPAILRHIRVKERRGCSDPSLTWTLHTPRHVSAAMSYFMQMLLLMYLPSILQTKPDNTLRESWASWDVFLTSSNRTFFMSTGNILRVFSKTWLPSVTFLNTRCQTHLGICAQWCDIKTTGEPLSFLNVRETMSYFIQMFLPMYLLKAFNSCLCKSSLKI